MFYRIGIAIILVCVLLSPLPSIGAEGPSVAVLVVPFDMGEAGGLSLARRSAMETLASALDAAGARLAGIDELKDLMLKQGVARFTEAGVYELGARVKADYAIMGTMAKDAGALGVEWRVIDLRDKTVIAAYAKTSPSEAEVLKTVKESAEAIHARMVGVMKARPAGRAGVIDRVEASGMRRIDKEAVLKKAASKAGAPFSPDDVREDIRNIYSTGYFDDVSADLSDTASGKTLTFIVREMPFIKKIAFKGNSELKDDKLKEGVTIKENTVLDRPLLESNAGKIKGIYAEEGYYLTTVKPVVTSDGAIAAVTFEIDEGPEVKVRRITVIGAEHFDEDNIKGFMSTKEIGIFSALTGSGKFDEQKFASDLAVVMGHYYDDGYITAELLDHRVLLSEDKRWFDITLAVSEGVQYRIGRIDVAGDVIVPKEELIDKLKLEPGGVFDRSKFSKGMDAIGDAYGDKGYAYADIKPTTGLNAEKQTVDVTLDIKKNELAYIERIDIAGNTRTRDKVIRREIELGEGDLFASGALKRSNNNLRRLGYFEDVRVRDTQGSGPDKIKLDVDVKERPTGSVSVGAGYSSVDKLIGTASIAQTNLMGTGLKLDLSGTVSASSSKYVLGFTEPWLFDKPISAGFDVYDTSKDYPDFSLKKRGFDVRLGFPVTDRYTYGFLTYRLEDAKVDNVASNASKFVRDQAGSSTTSSMNASLKRDTRDDAFFPGEGSVLTLSTEVAGGVFGGSTNFVKYETDDIKYFPLPWETTFSARGSAGYIQGYGGKEPPVYEKYYLGGINTLRGFRTRSVGPKDQATDEVIGGNTMAFANFEFLFPLIPEQHLRGLVFFDIGNAYQGRINLGDLRKGAGAGLRWFSPIGPLRFEYGVNLERRPGEKEHQWEFNIGSNF
ncbi:MAG: outer membrane protein assembly factor BamA [Deltaproteobacteria bacterium]|nr:outer membrane protein assembly factor BamA [Deltaproteobacteria bacterium]